MITKPFSERPRALKGMHSELYDELKKLVQQDTLAQLEEAQNVQC